MHRTGHVERRVAVEEPRRLEHEVDRDHRHHRTPPTREMVHANSAPHALFAAGSSAVPPRGRICGCGCLPGRIQRGGRRLQVGLARDVVPVEGRAAPVSRDRHHDPLGHARPDEVTDAAAPQIVHERRGESAAVRARAQTRSKLSRSVPTSVCGMPGPGKIGNRDGITRPVARSRAQTRSTWARSMASVSGRRYTGGHRSRTGVLLPSRPRGPTCDECGLRIRASPHRPGQIGRRALDPDPAQPGSRAAAPSPGRFREGQTWGAMGLYRRGSGNAEWTASLSEAR
jgi:hypothetical protein